MSILRKHYCRLALFSSSPHDIHDGSLSETDTGETNLLSDQVWQFLHTAARPDCLARTLDTRGSGILTSFISLILISSLAKMKIHCLSQVWGWERLSCSAAASAGAGEPAPHLPVQCPGKFFSFSSPLAQKQKSIDIRAAYTALLKPRW